MMMLCRIYCWSTLYHVVNTRRLGLAAILCIFAIVFAADPSRSEPSMTDLPGHLKPFGESGLKREIEVRTAWPDPDEFLRDYVAGARPLKLAGVMRDSRAVRLWTDQYLLSLNVPEDNVVHLETRKKENRSQETAILHFHEFLRVYNTTEHYMVDDVPAFLKPDMTVPCSLQCEKLLDRGFATAVMWFSSGGTKSVVHTDSFDNINCLIRGDKTLVMMDPARDRDKIELTQTGAFSNVDVDSVDLLKYPGLAESEFYHINVTAGDCLFIPYKWIHQVRSYGSNVAVNLWWDHYGAVDLATSNACPPSTCDQGLTLDALTFKGEDGLGFDDLNMLKDWLFDFVVNRRVTEDGLFELLTKDFDNHEKTDDIRNHVKQTFSLLDFDEDGFYTMKDYRQLDDKAWEQIREHVNALDATSNTQEEMEGEHEQHKDEL